MNVTDQHATNFPRTKHYPDPRTEDSREHRRQRFFEVIPGMLTWSTLIGMFVLSFLLPIWVAIFIIAFDIYWLFRTIHLSNYSVLAYRKLNRSKSINWLEACEQISDKKAYLKKIHEKVSRLKDKVEKNRFFFFKKERREIKAELASLLELKSEVSAVKADQEEIMDWRTVYHVVLLPTANEGAEIIRPAIEAVAKSNYPNEKFIILLATEEREDLKRRREKVEILRGEFRDIFFDFLVTEHKVQAGEMKAKASNTTFAVKELVKYLKNKKIPLENVILSNFDCDTCAHPEYFAALTFKYIAEPKRLRFAYQPLPMYHNNIWDTNAFVRIIVTASSFWHMIQAMRPEHMVTFSSHSEPLQTIVDVDYWPVNVISEDSVIFWKCYNHFDGDYQVKPIYLPVSLDAVLASTYWQTITNQYKQKRRWAYGIENFPMLARAFLRNKKIKLSKKIGYLFTMLEGHHSWATNSLIVALLGWLPVVIGGSEFNESVIAHNLPIYTRYLMNLALIGLVVSMSLNFLMLPPRPARYGKIRYVHLVLQWFLVPITAVFLGAIPAIDAQTRIMLGKYFGEFWVTEKIRKE